MTAVADEDDDAVAPCVLRLRHPAECRPYRPEHRPAWSPGRRDRRDAGRPKLVDRPERLAPRLVSAANLGAVRVNFRYASFQAMMAAHSEKAGRDQFFEGPHETYGFRLHEIEPSYLDLQYQPIRVEWKTAAGKAHSLTLDWAVETQEGRIAFGEDKADDGYFADPELEERLDFAEAFLATMGASLERRVAAGLPTRLRRRVVKDVFDARRTGYDDAAASRVQLLIREAGGTARLADVLASLGDHPRLALEIARAMMHRRVLSMPLAAPPMPDTPVVVPPPATKGLLRAFLAKHVPA